MEQFTGFWRFYFGPKIRKLVGGLEHVLFFHILEMIIPTDELIFLRGFDTTRKIDLKMWSQVAKVNSLFQCSLISHFGRFQSPFCRFAGFWWSGLILAAESAPVPQASQAWGRLIVPWCSFRMLRISESSLEKSELLFAVSHHVGSFQKPLSI